MMKQYLRFKAEHPDAILFFHLGDFYEAFFDDATTLARELDIVLTSRNGHPMAGVPIRSGEAYVNQLLKRGYKVAVCQQVEDPKKAKGLVKRDIVRVVTPGTSIDDGVLDAGTNNYMCAIFPADAEERFGVSLLDLSTGEFLFTVAESLDALLGEVERREPSELLLPASFAGELARRLSNRMITRVPDAAFSSAAVEYDDVEADEMGLRAAGAVLTYINETQKAAQAHIRPLRSYRVSDHMDLDPFTVSSLELVRPLRDGQQRGTLLHVLDRTVTGMGRRRLRRLILAPLTDRREIGARLDAVETLVEASLVRQELREQVDEIHDLERLIGRLGSGRMRPHDLLLLVRSLDSIPGIARSLVKASGGERSSQLRTELSRIKGVLEDPAFEPLYGQLSGMLVDQPPPDARDGGLICDGYDGALDALREEIRTLRRGLTTLEQEERQETGIPLLKVGYNKVFGYYWEVTRPHLDKVPSRFRRRQTLANAERFVTEELRGFEEKISFSEERETALELDLFERALNQLKDAIPALQALADALADLDLFLALAEVAHRNDYVRPSFTDHHAIHIRAGRHPVVEQIEEFVPNDLDLPEGKDLVILTGPNMAGKSVYLRQTALICLMAQMGSFVPAEQAVLPMVDRIFARVGASDMLVAGVSTFMMEMLEIAAILARGTARSLVILDEMGRGTSTFDGVSIAWAVADELAKTVRAKTLFATHYQELTRLADDVSNATNLHVAVKEVGAEVVFLHRVEPGTAEGSYGVHVARLAGLPEHVTDAADRILDELLDEAPLSRLGHAEKTAEPIPLFGGESHPVLRELRALDPNCLTPLEALRLLAELRERLDE
jgi:DNA mismatch repair protein MutS